MARRSHHVLSAAAAGACLTLSACGAASAPSAAGSAPASSPATAETTGPATLTGHFCGDASSFMQHIPAGPTTKNASPAKARANLRTVLRSTVSGFTGLRAEAPRDLRKPLKKIVNIYKSDEKVLKASGSLTRISESVVKGNASGAMAFQRLLKYMSVKCK
jgi:hypothetical protein